MGNEPAYRQATAEVSEKERDQAVRLKVVCNGAVARVVRGEHDLMLQL